MEKDDLKFIHNIITHQIDKTDTKANFLLILQLAVIGYLFTRLDTLNFSNYIMITSLIITLILIIISLIFILKTVWPRLTSDVLNTKSSLIYFRHIINSFKIENDELLKRFKDCNSEEFNKDLTNQIISLSNLALNKYKNIHKAIIFIILQIISLIILIILSSTIK